MAITIEINETKIITNEDGSVHRNVSFDISNNDDADGNKYAWSRGSLPEVGDLHTFLDSEADKLWNAAKERGHVADTLAQVSIRALLIALIFLIMDEINILRNLHGLQPRTTAQFVTALKSKLSIKNGV